MHLNGKWKKEAVIFTLCRSMLKMLMKIICGLFQNIGRHKGSDIYHIVVTHGSMFCPVFLCQGFLGTSLMHVCVFCMFTSHRSCVCIWFWSECSSSERNWAGFRDTQWNRLSAEVLLPLFSRRSALTSYRALLKLMELALDKAQHQAGLADRRLAQQHQFELTDFVAGCVWPIRSCSTASSCHDPVTNHLLLTWVWFL